MDDYELEEMMERADMAADEMRAELSRLRELVKEMREALADITSAEEASIYRNVHPSCISNQVARLSPQKSAIAKADAYLKERGEAVRR